LTELSRSASFLLKQSTLMERRGRPDRAYEAVRRAVSYEPDDFAALTILDRGITTAAGAAEILPMLDEIRERHPDQVIVLNVTAKCLDLTGRTEEAIRMYEETIRLHPKDPRTYTRLAIILIQQGKMREAEGLLRQALDLDPNSTGALLALVQVLRAGQRWEEMVDALNGILAATPTKHEVWCDLGLVLLEIDRDRSAIRAFRESLAYQPDFGPALRGLTATLANTGQHAEAIEVAQRWTIVEPNNVDSHFAHAQLAAALNRRDVAVRACQRVVQLRPDHAGARRLMARLQP
jgi:tetratricopeptide (TPR) repeat protein